MILLKPVPFGLADTLRDGHQHRRAHNRGKDRNQGVDSYAERPIGQRAPFVAPKEENDSNEGYQTDHHGTELPYPAIDREARPTLRSLGLLQVPFRGYVQLIVSRLLQHQVMICTVSTSI